MSEPTYPPATKLSGLSAKYIFIITMLSLGASVSTAQLLIRGGLPVSHDMIFHLFQADQFHRGIASGAILPRWAVSANNGYGSPNFIFYAPLGYYLASLIRFFTSSPAISLIITTWCSFLFSGLAMHFAVKRIHGSKGALLAAVFYQVLPFHLLNLYGRGAFAELCAYAWFPLIILFMHEMLSRKNPVFSYAGLGLSYAGLILTHLVSAFMFTFVIFLYMICFYCYKRSGKAILAALSALAAGVGISSFYLLPVIFERKYVQIEYMFNYVFSDYRNNFLFLKNGFDSSFRVALHGGVILELILFLAIIPQLLRGKGERSKRFHYSALCIIFIFAIILATQLSAPLWSRVPGFAVLQFPWRWISVAEISLCFLAGAFLSEIGPRCLVNAGQQGRMALYSMIAILSLSFMLVLKSGGIYGAPFLAKITDAEQVKRYTNLPKEYTPIWATDVENIVAEGKAEKILALSGKANLRAITWEPERRLISINASTPLLLRIATFYYPGWDAETDGNKSNIAIEPKSGAMLIAVPAGEHTLKLFFGDTPLRAFSRYVSFGSCAVLAIYVLFHVRKRLKLAEINNVENGQQHTRARSRIQRF